MSATPAALAEADDPARLPPPSLSLRSFGWALALGTGAAVALSPIFSTPFLPLLGRLLLIALLLLLAFVAAGRWTPPRWPRWIVQAVAVALTAPLATLAVYLLPEGGRLAPFLDNPARVSGFLWIAGTALVVGVVLALAALYREREAQARALALRFALERSQRERQALDARLATLRSQVEPHFLFNTLANVQALVESGSPRAAPVLQSLIDYLRAAMPKLDEADETLGAEARRVRAYLALMQLRMPDRLRPVVRIDESLSAERFPSMALLTLVENAVRHGIDPSEAGGTIEVEARREPGGLLRLVVADSGVGLPAAVGGGGVGLANLRARLDGFFDGRAALSIGEPAQGGVRAEILVRPGAGRVVSAAAPA